MKEQRGYYVFSDYKEKTGLLFCMDMVALGVLAGSGFLLSVVLLVQFLDLAFASQVMRTL